MKEAGFRKLEDPPIAKPTTIIITCQERIQGGIICPMFNWPNNKKKPMMTIINPAHMRDEVGLVALFLLFVFIIAYIFSILFG